MCSSEPLCIRARSVSRQTNPGITAKGTSATARFRGTRIREQREPLVDHRPGAYLDPRASSVLHGALAIAGRRQSSPSRGSTGWIRKLKCVLCERPQRHGATPTSTAWPEGAPHPGSVTVRAPPIPPQSFVTARPDPCCGGSSPAHATAHRLDERRPYDSADTATGAQAAVVRRHNECLWVS